MGPSKIPLTNKMCDHLTFERKTKKYIFKNLFLSKSKHVVFFMVVIRNQSQHTALYSRQTAGVEQTGVWLHWLLCKNTTLFAVHCLLYEIRSSLHKNDIFWSSSDVLLCSAWIQSDLWDSPTSRWLFSLMKLFLTDANYTGAPWYGVPCQPASRQRRVRHSVRAWSGRVSDSSYYLWMGCVHWKWALPSFPDSSQFLREMINVQKINSAPPSISCGLKRDARGEGYFIF